jgi:acyl-CoA reductase-like NAD-dependent aldehyde dehydrogenase
MARKQKTNTTQKMYLGGVWESADQSLEVVNPYDNKVIANVAAASKADYTRAIQIADKTFAQTRELPSYKRSETCRAVADLIEKNLERFTTTMVQELGKCYKDAKGEVQRAVGVFRVAAEEAKRIGGEIIDLDWTPGAEERTGLVKRFPMGVVAGISPFNFPLNLVAHKVAPAIASGNTIVLKPASATPLSALLLAEMIDQTDHPKGAVSVLPGSSKESSPLLEDERVKLITFTGSSQVGWWIKQNAGKKHVVLELGGNAGVAVADDADLDWAATRLVYGSFASAGQSCISVQRIYIHEKVYDRFLRIFKQKVAKVKTGNPMNPKVDMGAMIDRDAVRNTLEMIEEARSQGAKVLAGGKARGAVLQPTLLSQVTPNMRVCSEEAFAPLAVLFKYRSFTSVVNQINSSNYGLQAGVFTNRLKDIWYAFKHIEAGGVVVNDVPTYRADHQPYGGVKDSGMGREGVRYSIEDMTELKILSMNLK